MQDLIEKCLSSPVKVYARAFGLNKGQHEDRNWINLSPLA